MKVLVTGGAGYIGSTAVKELIERGHDVVVIDNLSTGHEEAIHKQATFYKMNIQDPEVSEVIKKEQVEAVIHFAAYSLVGESMTNPYKYYENNLSGTNKLLNSIVNAGVKYLVFSSTAATYGEAEIIPITEENPTCPTNVYGETKLSMEKMINWYHKIKGLNYVCLRYFNVAGASVDSTIGEAHNPETHLIPIVLQVAKGTRDVLQIYGDDYPTKDGTCIRDYIHVVDLVDAHIKALEYMKRTNQSNTFNLGSGTGFSVKEILEAALKVTNKPIPHKISPRRAGDPAVLIASSKKANELLGWHPQYDDVEKMISDAWNWERNKRY